MSSAGSAAGTDRGRLPWLARWIEASGLPAFAAGALVSTAFVALSLAWNALGWALGVGDPRDPVFWKQLFGPNLINAALAGYAPAATAWSHRRALGELARLAPLLRAGGDEWRARVEAPPRLPMAVGGGLAGLFILPAVFLDASLHALFVRLDAFERAWLFFANFAVGWLLARTLLEELRVARIFSQAGRLVAGVDLFDLAPLEPFARRSAESVLVGSVGASLLSLIFAGDGWASDTLPYLVATVLAAAAVAFALPLVGVHARIREAKRAELARIHALAWPARDALLAGGAADPGEAARLAALLALRAQVADVREWPVDLPTLARLAGFLGIGLASWVGAALVDVAIEAALR